MKTIGLLKSPDPIRPMMCLIVGQILVIEMSTGCEHPSPKCLKVIDEVYF